MKTVIRLKTIDSTHKFALRWIEGGKDISEYAIIADRQTDSIGRCGRKWTSVPGNLFVSFIKTFPDYADLGQLSITTACAVRESIGHYLPDDSHLYLRWPNDIYYKKSKISGILLAALGHWLVISVGVNVNPVPSLSSAISIGEVLKSFDGKSRVPTSREMLPRVSADIEKWFDNLKDLGFFYVRDHWLRYINEIDCKITIKNGRESLCGVFSGIDEFGRLILKKNDRSIFVSSGDVFINEEGITVQYE
ncbi:MAG: biotin--[acetyl-CoA-carboxylase] ligase [Holosporaceae bacterium]|jgi:BirA family biotin operon repressor/biotin-[acetyl-CoA-carboxylase] ligase|nr:biotin--[acetyl-CoA-carboxylase] ligase [Holosporaceae bacterium]